MTFDPTKPIAEKTACGKFTVKNFRKRQHGNDGGGRTEDYPFAVDVLEGNGQWVMSTAENGNQYRGCNGYQLVNAPSPVDWGKPVRWKDSKAPVERIGTCRKANGVEFFIVKWSHDGDEHSMEIDPSCDSVCVENVPPEPRTVKVEIAGVRHRVAGSEYAAIKLGHTIMIYDEPSGVILSSYSDRQPEVRARELYDIDPFHPITLTLPVQA